MGIGLAVCRRLVDAQGGTLWAESGEGSGTAFSLRLRLAGEEPWSHEMEPPGLSERAHGRPALADAEAV